MFFRNLFKYLFLAINAICVVLGVVLVVFGGYMLVSRHDNSILQIIQDNKTVSFACVLFGLVTLLVSGFGACGVLTETSFFLIAYILAMGLVIVVEIGLTTFATTSKKGIQELGQHVWLGASDSFRDYFQAQFRCCAYNGIVDFESDADKVKELWKCREGGSEENPVYFQQGCGEVILTFIERNKIIFIGVAAGIIVFHAIVFSMASCNVCYKRAYAHKLKVRRISQRTGNTNNQFGSRIGPQDDNSDVTSMSGEMNGGYQYNTNYEESEMSPHHRRLSKQNSRISTGKFRKQSVARNSSAIVTGHGRTTNSTLPPITQQNYE